MSARTAAEEVEQANAAYYAAMEAGDFDALAGLWLDTTDDVNDGDGSDIACVHPGWPVLSGRGEVLRSYAVIMANTEYIQFFLTDVAVTVHGQTALLTCTENILSGAPAPEDEEGPGPLLGQLVVATNLFRRTAAGWRLWSHHASPVLTRDDDEEDGPDEEPRGPGDATPA
ncbi:MULTISPECIES: nuclear transport factor 2 family protein [unclassified Streptomyces]|uniref:nuclear transport factor 2 family protein n=1 Tax=unclassified Streptomyces TaxID=2593676 RepID=UPI00030704B6|nr:MULTISPECIES: nuclear transport factor 2 family protein [unclassified Streptomyces]MYR29151.1 DUF4440 domain-containing protein [Streptomyces sp. SID4945]SCF44282.1 Ketosteroid isomerase homolog [Streptomyces sp. LcepLS]